MKKFGLRSLLVLVTLIAIVFAGFGNQLKIFRTECPEIRKISAASTIAYRPPQFNRSCRMGNYPTAAARGFLVTEPARVPRDG